MLVAHQRNDVDTYPLSFAQQRLWFLHQLTPGNPVYNVPQPVHLKGPLNVLALEQTLGEILRRHEILRTTFLIVNGGPFRLLPRHSH